jgi:hypothetical protein
MMKPESEDVPKIEVELVPVAAIPLDPAKKYLIVVDRDALSGWDIEKLLESLKSEYGVDASMAVLTKGDPFSSVQVIEVGSQ